MKAIEKTVRVVYTVTMSGLELRDIRSLLGIAKQCSMGTELRLGLEALLQDVDAVLNEELTG